MKAKKIITIMMVLTLALGVVGCGKDKEDTSTSTATQEESKDSKTIEKNEKNLFELGAKQTKDIKAIVEKYGAKTEYNLENNSGVNIAFSKDENDCSASGATGYNVTTLKELKANDGGDNSYSITYGSYISKDKESYYAYDIDMVYPDAQEFKLENFKMLKDLVQAYFGDDYDMASVESWIQDHIKGVNDGTVEASGKDIGSFREGLMGGEKGSKSKSKGQTLLTYRLTLKE